MSREAVGELLEERGVRYSRSRRNVDGKQCRTWEGIGLRTDAPGRLAVPGPQQKLEDVKAKLRRALAALEAE